MFGAFLLSSGVVSLLVRSYLLVLGPHFWNSLPQDFPHFDSVRPVPIVQSVI